MNQADFQTKALKTNLPLDTKTVTKQVAERQRHSRAGLALSVMAFEYTPAAVAADNVAKGVMLTDTDRARLMVAANRSNQLVEAFA